MKGSIGAHNLEMHLRTTERGEAQVVVGADDVPDSVADVLELPASLASDCHCNGFQWVKCR